MPVRVSKGEGEQYVHVHVRSETFYVDMFVLLLMPSRPLSMTQHSTTFRLVSRPEPMRYRHRPSRLLI